MPPEAIFADEEGNPSHPFTDSDGKGAEYFDEVARRTRLLIKMTESMDNEDLASIISADLHSDTWRMDRSREHLFKSPLIEDITPDKEEDDALQLRERTMEMFVQIILLVALFSDRNASSLQSLRPWADNAAASASQSLLEVLLHKSGETHAADKPGDTCSILMAKFLPHVLKKLAYTLHGPEEHARKESNLLEPYQGPDRWTRLIAASQLTWVIFQISVSEMRQIPPSMILPTLRAMISFDPFPCVQAYSLWILHHVCASCTTERDLQQWIKADVKPTIERGTIACDSKAWPAAVAASSSLALASFSCKLDENIMHDIFKMLLREGERYSHKASRVLVWLQQVTPMFRPFKFQLCRYLAILMPLLIEWILGPRGDVRLLALGALQECIYVVWPQMPRHALVIWAVLEKAYDQESKFPSQTSDSIMNKIEQCGQDLWICGGSAFRTKLRDSKFSSSEVQKLATRIIQSSSEAQ